MSKGELNMQAIKTEIYKNHKIEIYQDSDPESPREWDNVGTMVCFHSRYTLGDKHGFGSPDEFQEWVEENKEDIVVILPIYMYDHSGITISTSRTGQYVDRWDSGQVGYIYVTKDKVKEEWGETDKAIEKATSYLEGEVETYDQYLTGDIYGFIINGLYVNGDSCWNFYGEKSAIEEAKSEIDSSINYYEKQLVEYNEIGLEGYVVLPPYPFDPEDSEE
jgi:hypothetical protein